jgi:hypothetical protein
MDRRLLLGIDLQGSPATQHALCGSPPGAAPAGAGCLAPPSGHRATNREWASLRRRLARPLPPAA